MAATLIKSAQVARLAPVLAPLELRDVQREADAILEAARRQAADAIRQADEVARNTLEQSRTQVVAEADALRRQAYEQGIADGREDGRRQVIEQSLGEAREQFARQAADAVKLLDELSKEWQLRRRQLFVDARHDVATLAIAIVRRVAPRLAELDAAIAVEACGTALGILGEFEELAIRAHPQEIEAVKQFAEQTFSALQSAAGVRWMMDESVERGGVRLEARAGAIDARLAKQVERIADDLLSGWRERIAMFESSPREPST